MTGEWLDSFEGHCLLGSINKHAMFNTTCRPYATTLIISPLIVVHFRPFILINTHYNDDVHCLSSARSGRYN